MLLRQVSVPKALIGFGTLLLLAQQLLMTIHMNTALWKIMPKWLGCAQGSG